MRLHAQSAAIENGLVWLPAEAPRLAHAISELTAFPMGRHDFWAGRSGGEASALAAKSSVGEAVSRIIATISTRSIKDWPSQYFNISFLHSRVKSRSKSN